MDQIRQMIERALPEHFNATQYFTYIVIVMAGILIIGGTFRMCLGKGSVVNGAVSSAISIFNLYVISILLYSFGGRFQLLFSPLPFVEITSGTVRIFPILQASFQEICREILSMLVLAYLMNLLENWLPKGEKPGGWFCFKALALLLALSLNYCISLLLNNVLPAHVLNSGPVTLLMLVMFSFMLAVMKIIVKGLAFLNPTLAIFHKFFFSQLLGKQLYKALLTTGALTTVVVMLNRLSITSITIGSVAFLTYLPVILLAILLWYLLAKVL